MDVVSDAIEMMRTGRPSSMRLRVGSAWCYRFAPYHGAGFHVLLRGSGWLIPDEGKSLPIGVGDMILLPRGSPHVLSDSPHAEHAVPFEAAAADPDGSTEFLCGKYRLAQSWAHPLLADLPDVIHLPTRLGQNPELRAAIDLLGSELQGSHPGYEAAISGLLDLLLVYTLRAWLGENPTTGWSHALHDPEILAALQALHTDPARPWRVDLLAAHVGLSRATLARRFTALTGQPPMAYLTWWRMSRARRLLHDTDYPLPVIARQVGYDSPFAFSHAFKRQTGLAPTQYRTARQPPDSPSATVTEPGEEHVS